MTSTTASVATGAITFTAQAGTKFRVQTSSGAAGADYAGISSLNHFDAPLQGNATFKDGYLWASDAPGWGIEVDEKLAKTFPFRENALNGGWGEVRRLDGTVIKQ